MKKEYLFDDMPSYGFPGACAHIEEKRLNAGDTLNLNYQVLISIHYDCILTLEMLTKAKRAFEKSLRKSLNGKNY